MTRRDFFGRLCGLAGAGVAAAGVSPLPPAPAAPFSAGSPTWTVSTGANWTFSGGDLEPAVLNAILAFRNGGVAAGVKP